MGYYYEYSLRLIKKLTLILNQILNVLLFSMFFQGILYNLTGFLFFPHIIRIIPEEISYFLTFNPTMRVSDLGISILSNIIFGMHFYSYFCEKYDLLLFVIVNPFSKNIIFGNLFIDKLKTNFGDNTHHEIYKNVSILFVDKYDIITKWANFAKFSYNFEGEEYIMNNNLKNIKNLQYCTDFYQEIDSQSKWLPLTQSVVLKSTMSIRVNFKDGKYVQFLNCNKNIPDLSDKNMLVFKVNVQIEYSRIRNLNRKYSKIIHIDSKEKNMYEDMNKYFRIVLGWFFEDKQANSFITIFNLKNSIIDIFKKKCINEDIHDYLSIEDSQIWGNNFKT